ncbi:MAG: hypothetical protein QOF93_1308 [Verrucomicrobiota bacterium]|jgi:hypothetical protein
MRFERFSSEQHGAASVLNKNYFLLTGVKAWSKT